MESTGDGAAQVPPKVPLASSESNRGPSLQTLLRVGRYMMVALLAMLVITSVAVPVPGELLGALAVGLASAFGVLVPELRFRDRLIAFTGIAAAVFPLLVISRRGKGSSWKTLANFWVVACDPRATTEDALAAITACSGVVGAVIILVIALTASSKAVRTAHDSANSFLLVLTERAPRTKAITWLGIFFGYFACLILWRAGILTIPDLHS